MRSERSERTRRRRSRAPSLPSPAGAFSFLRDLSGFRPLDISERGFFFAVDLPPLVLLSIFSISSIGFFLFSRVSIGRGRGRRRRNWRRRMRVKKRERGRTRGTRSPTVDKPSGVRVLLRFEILPPFCLCISNN